MDSMIPPESFMDLLLDALCIVDRDGYIRYVSSSSHRIFGYQPEEMIGRAVLDFVHPDDQHRTAYAVEEILQGEPKPNFENRYVRKDGSTANILWSARWSDSQQVRVALARDITERKKAEARQSAIYAISEAVHNADNLSSLFEAIHGIVDGLLATPIFTVVLVGPDSNTLDVHYNANNLEDAASDSKSVACELCSQLMQSEATKLVRPDALGVQLISPKGVCGAVLLQRLSGSTLFSEHDRDLLDFVGVQISAAVERKRMLSQLEYMASYDQLTGLPNRHIVLDRMQNALARVTRDQGILAILYLDLDKFKKVNDTYGHGAGDEILVLVARRMVGCVRASDTVGRMGGDEFVVLLDNLKQQSDAVGIAEKIRSTLSEPYELSVATLNLIPSIGIAFYPDHGRDMESLISAADSGMYLEKKSRS